MLGYPVTYQHCLSRCLYSPFPKTFEASFVVAAQPVADPCGTAYLEVGSLLHGHVKHAYHADGNYSGSNLVVILLFVRFFRVLPVLCRPCIREMRSDLQTFRLITRELWRVAIVLNGQSAFFDTVLGRNPPQSIQRDGRTFCLPHACSSNLSTIHYPQHGQALSCPTRARSITCRFCRPHRRERPLLSQI